MSHLEKQGLTNLDGGVDVLSVLRRSAIRASTRADPSTSWHKVPPGAAA